MPNITIVNVSGGESQLVASGQTIARLPNGFDGVLNLSSPFGVMVGAQFVEEVSTNGVPSSGGYSVVNIIYSGTNAPGSGTGGEFGPLVLRAGVGGPIFNSGDALVVGTIPHITGANGFQITMPAVPNSASVTYSITDLTDPGPPWFAWSSPLTTNSFQTVTNYTPTGGTLLATVTPNSMLKSVQIQPGSVVEATFEAESAAVSLGFGFGIVIAIFIFTVRLIRSIPTQGGDF